MKPLFAETETVNGISWTYSTESGIATITGQSGASGAIVIPNALGGVPVKKLGANLFYNNSAITSVQMTNVTHAESQAFRNCENLTTVEMPNIESIGSDCFYLCRNLTGDLKLPKLTSLSNFGFQKTGITSISVPNVTSIGTRTFEGCNKLRNVSIPFVTSIGEQSFENCTSLKNIDLRFVETIGKYAFRYDAELTDVDLSRLKSAGEGAVSGCANIRGSLYLPKLETIGKEAFSGLGIDSLYMPIVTKVGYGAFNSCYSLTNVAAPRVTHIESHAFDKCTNLLHVGFMPLLAQLDSTAFLNCKSLSYVKLSRTLATLGTEVFAGCAQLSEIALHVDSQLDESLLPQTAEITRHGGAEAIDGVTWQYDVLQDGTAVILSQTGAAGNVTVPSTLAGHSVTRLGPGVFNRNTAITGIAMPSITRIDENAVRECTNLATVDMPNVEIVGENAFFKCTNLKVALNLPELKEVARWGFQQTGITSISMPNAKSIEYKSFEGCAELASVNASGIDYIGAEAFCNCAKLSAINIANVREIDAKAFYQLALISTQLNLPNVTFMGDRAFQQTAITAIVLPELTRLGQNAFYACRYVTRIDTPKLQCIDKWGLQTLSSDIQEFSYMPRLKSLRYGVFKDVPGLTAVKLPYCTHDFGTDVFSGCGNLQTIAVHECSPLDEAVLKMGVANAAVVRYGGYEDVDGVRWLYDELADGKAVVVGAIGAVGDLEIPKSLNGKRVTQIETGAFEDYFGITSVKLPYGITVVGEDAFLNCDVLEVIRVLQTNTGLIASLKQEYGEDRVMPYAPGGTVITLR